jgi:hypothetical protein
VIGVAGAMIGAAALLLVILAWVRAEMGLRKSNADWDPAPPDQDESREACPLEFVTQIFSEEDLEFLSKLKSPHLDELFQRERTAVALLWVQETSAAIGLIMKRHLEASRLSEDLEFAVEARVFLLYVRLRVICGLLFLLIGLAGPQRLRGMALYTDRLTQRIGASRREFETGTRAREMNGARPS